jgi:hypothetical protein
MTDHLLQKATMPNPCFTTNGIRGIAETVHQSPQHPIASGDLAIFKNGFILDIAQKSRILLKQ